MFLSDVFEKFVLRFAEQLAPSAINGRKRLLEDKVALSCIFKVLRTGMQWREIDTSVHFTTIFRRMHLWMQKGVFDAAYTAALKVYAKLSPPKRYCVDSSYVKK